MSHSWNEKEKEEQIEDEPQITWSEHVWRNNLCMAERYICVYIYMNYIYNIHAALLHLMKVSDL